MKVKRKQTDICLLCEIDPATKTKSHIFPKFLSNKFFGPKSSKKGFQISSNQPSLEIHKIVQDSPKDDYLLCPDCEEYFSILERNSANTFINWKEYVSKGQFAIQPILEGYSIVYCNTSNKATIRLFLYSIFWRASISNDPLFNNIKILPAIEEELRQILVAYKAKKQSIFLELLNKNSVFKIFPVTIITADSFRDETGNILYVPFYNGAYRLIIDQFSFLLFKSVNEIPESFLTDASNTEITDCKIIIFSKERWYDIIVKPAMDILAQTIKENLQK